MLLSTREVYHTYVESGIRGRWGITFLITKRLPSFVDTFDMRQYCLERLEAASGGPKAVNIQFDA